MYSALGLLVVLGSAAAQSAYDDGLWRPERDGSSLGSGLLRYGTDDGSWKPDQDGSWLGRGDLVWLNRKRREANPNSLSQPADEPVVAHAKNAQLRQQYSEGKRNILGGGIPEDLPADTPEVAEGKRAHAIAHENEKLATSGARYATPVHHVTSISSVATPVARAPTPVAQIGTRVALVGSTSDPSFYPHHVTIGRSISPISHVSAPLTAVTVSRTVTPVAHIATPFAHVASPVVHTISPYHYAYSPVVQAVY